MHHDRGFRHTQARTADLFRHRDAQPAAFGHAAVIFYWEAALFLTIGPVLVAELSANLAHAGVNRGLFFRQLHVHDVLLAVFSR